MTDDNDEPSGGPAFGRMTREGAERLAALLGKPGDLRAGAVAEDVVRRVQKNRDALTTLVQREVKRQVGSLGIATRDELARLQQRVRALEQELADRGWDPAAHAPGEPQALEHGGPSDPSDEPT